MTTFRIRTWVAVLPRAAAGRLSGFLAAAAVAGRGLGTARSA
ncbi:hypothetical protein [Pseudonocardia acidicola]|nr:hypothetical protein [Pseudonocardia acidicola]